MNWYGQGTWKGSGALGMVFTGGRGGGRDGTSASLLSPGLRGIEGGAGA